MLPFVHVKDLVKLHITSCHVRYKITKSICLNHMRVCDISPMASAGHVCVTEVSANIV
jgi:hypothetical protein